MLGKHKEGGVEKFTFDKHIGGWGILGISFWCCSLSAVKNYFIKLIYWLIYPSPPPLWCNSSKSKNKIVNKCFEFIFFSIFLSHIVWLVLLEYFECELFIHRVADPCFVLMQSSDVNGFQMFNSSIWFIFTQFWC